MLNHTKYIKKSKNIFKKLQKKLKKITKSNSRKSRGEKSNRMGFPFHNFASFSYPISSSVCFFQDIFWWMIRLFSVKLKKTMTMKLTM